MKNIFIFAYYSYKDPVFQSAVLPYLLLMEGEGIKFILLTWEKKEFNIDQIEKQAIKKQLHKNNIIWFSTAWNSGNFKIIKKNYDFIKGVIYSLYLIKKFKCDKIFSEGFPGAIIGFFISKLISLPHIVHTYEPHADYMKESGVWDENNWEYRIIKNLELKIAKKSECIITATNAYSKILKNKLIDTEIKVIPSCVDYKKFYFSKEDRDNLRRKLGIRDSEILFIYTGKMGGMYMKSQLFDFISFITELNSSYKFYLGTKFSEKEIIKELEDRNVSLKKVKIGFIENQDMYKYLSAADIAFCGIKPIPSRRYSSPIKNGEYWACGLPVIIPKGISDDYLLIEKEEIGIVYEEYNKISNEKILEINKISRSKIISKTKPFRNIHNYKKDFETLFTI